MKTGLLAGILVFWASMSLAHSPLKTTTPTDNATVAAAPSEVQMGFKGNIRLTRVTMRHAGKDGVAMELGSQTSFMQDFVLPLPDMGPGEYVIEWRGLGDDGHALNGSFAFSVE